MCFSASASVWAGSGCAPSLGVNQGGHKSLLAALSPTNRFKEGILGGSVCCASPRLCLGAQLALPPLKLSRRQSKCQSVNPFYCCSGYLCCGWICSEGTIPPPARSPSCSSLNQPLIGSVTPSQSAETLRISFFQRGFLLCSLLGGFCQVGTSPLRCSLILFFQGEQSSCWGFYVFISF